MRAARAGSWTTRRAATKALTRKASSTRSGNGTGTSSRAMRRFSAGRRGKVYISLSCPAGGNVTSLNVNGTAREVQVDGDPPLLYVLRNDLGLKATRFGCGAEQCGTCMVLVEGK